MAQVVLRELNKKYDEVHAVKDVNLTIRDKEFMVLVGPSGCGKTTTLRMIAGLEDITSGEIVIGDRVVNDLPPKDRDIAMVFQNYALYPHMSVYDNMAFGLKMRKFSKPEIQKRVQDAAEILGIQELLKRKPRQLSGGQRQRVAVGRAIVRQPRAFLFDEPLSNLATADHIPGSHEPPDYSHVTVGAGQVVIHQCSFLYAGPLFSLQDRDALEWINR